MPVRRIRRVSDLDWDRYKNIINDFIDNDAGRQPFLWLRKVNQPSAYGEDGSIIYTPIQLEGLFLYNYIKSWPTNSNSTTGELDLGNQVLYISARLLKNNDYLDEYGYWDYNWSEDRFIVNGRVFKPAGDTQVAQAKDIPLLFYVILKREDPSEVEKILDTYAGDNAYVSTLDGKYLVDAHGKKVRDFMGLPIKIKP